MVWAAQAGTEHLYAYAAGQHLDRWLRDRPRLLSLAAQRPAHLREMAGALSLGSPLPAVYASYSWESCGSIDPPDLKCALNITLDYWGTIRVSVLFLYTEGGSTYEQFENSTRILLEGKTNPRAVQGLPPQGDGAGFYRSTLQ